MDDLASLLQGLKVRAESYDNWCGGVREALEKAGEDRLELGQLREMFEEAVEGRFPRSELLEALQLSVEEAEKCRAVTELLCGGRRRTRLGEEKNKYRLTMEELGMFSSQLKSLPVKVEGQEGVEKLLENLEKFRAEAARLLESRESTVEEVEKCLTLADGLDIDLEEVGRLKTRKKQLAWIEQAEEAIDDPSDVNVEQLKELEMVGLDLPPHPRVEHCLARLRGLVITLEQWEEKAKTCLASENKYSLVEVEKLVAEGNNTCILLLIPRPKIVMFQAKLYPEPFPPWAP